MQINESAKKKELEEAKRAKKEIKKQKREKSKSAKKKSAKKQKRKEKRAQKMLHSTYLHIYKTNQTPRKGWVRGGCRLVFGRQKHCTVFKVPVI